MHVILVSNRLARTRTLNITPGLMVASATAFLVFALATSFLFSWLGVRLNLPFVSDMVNSVQEVHQRKNEEFLRENIAAMAVKLGEMQAKVTRLDLLGERVAKQSGVSVPKNEVNSKPTAGGSGGPLIRPSQPLSLDELQREISKLSQMVEQRDEDLTAIESQLMERRIKATLLPTLMPIEAHHVGSPFGRRVDPIAGVGAMHEGIDYVADIGTSVVASAAGVVTVAEYHPAYGYMIDIDHGNDFSSRYAHLSKMQVKVGQVIKRGQQIALSGNSGRSTGPHLHFEVRYRGAAQDPARFLQMGTQLAQGGAGAILPPDKNAGRAKSKTTSR